ncbi:MAG: hypothetical protein ACI9OJ_000221 [Myxococcota bacterium]|jgi:hypothetical protein
MYRKEVNLQSPLRVLEGSIHGGLGAGKLGVVMASAGAGKTACLVQIGLDDLLRHRPVLHLDVGRHSLDHVRNWYDALFEDLANVTELARREQVAAAVTERRLIQAFPSGDFTPEKLDQSLETYRTELGFTPAAILVDGFDWDADASEVRRCLTSLKATASRVEAELWLTATTPDRIGPHGRAIGVPCAPFAGLIDVAVVLEPEGNHVTIRLLKDHDGTEPRELRLKLQADTLRLVATGGTRATAPVPASARTLMSGAANGAEAAFGACAERWGIGEINYTFDGHPVARTRGLVELTDAQLEEGAVSVAYVENHMHRSYPRTALFRRLLQSIWHQVNTAGEVFAVGVILDDDTVKGGTGWAAELARHLNKPVHVYDQARGVWFTWAGKSWEACDDLVITSRRFTGTGSRFLSEPGRAAIEALFERSFGPAPQ